MNFSSSRVIVYDYFLCIYWNCSCNWSVSVKVRFIWRTFEFVWHEVWKFELQMFSFTCHILFVKYDIKLFVEEDIFSFDFHVNIILLQSCRKYKPLS